MPPEISGLFGDVCSSCVGDVTTAKLALVLGERNPHSHRPEDALLPWPRGASGDRLRSILALSDAEYLERFVRRNLLAKGESWRLPLARERGRLWLEAVPEIPVVALGSRVSLALGLRFEPYRLMTLADGRRATVLPHPSRRNQRWNRRDAAARARRAVSTLTDG